MPDTPHTGAEPTSDFSSATNVVADQLERAAGEVTDAADGVVDFAQRQGEAIWEDIETHLPVNAVADAAEDAAEAVAEELEGPLEALQDFVETHTPVNALVDEVENAVDAVAEQAEVLGDIIESHVPLDEVGKAFEDIGEEVGALFGGRRAPAEDRTRDSDSDGVTDWDERNVHGTDPLRWDTDGDGLGDGRELREYGTDPTAGDSDSDGLADGEELRRDTDPFSWDTDGDGWSDGMEARFTETDPLRQDTDGDGLTDRDEGMVHRTDPNERDTDGDGMGDGNELRHGTDALDFSVAQPYAELDEADLTVGGHDPLVVAGTIDDARGTLDAHAEPSGQPIRTLEPRPGDFGGIETGPPNPLGNLPADPTAGALTFVDEAPTEMIRPSPIQDAVTSTPDEALTTVALPPSPIDEAVSDWEADTPTELLPPSPIDDIDLDGLAGLGDPLFTPTPGIDDSVGDAVSPFEPGGLDTELDFGG